VVGTLFCICVPPLCLIAAIIAINFGIRGLKLCGIHHVPGKNKAVAAIIMASLAILLSGYFTLLFVVMVFVK